MQHVLIRRASAIVTMDDARLETSGDVRLRDGEIVEFGTDLDPTGAEVIDAEGAVVTPALVNTHHHMFQSLTRTVGQDAPLFGWLQTLYPIWARLTPDDIKTATRLALAELALSGCGMSSDHLYLYPNGICLEDSIEAAAETGLRFHATRGAMSIGESQGGLPPDALVEDEAAILQDCERVVAAFHDPRPASMVQVGIAPCSPFSVSRGLMRDAAILAREKGVRLHTHLAENDEDIAYSLAEFGCRPGDYAEALGWTGDDVWHAHCVRLDPGEVALFGRTGTGVAHCPCSNGRLGSGIAPVPAMRAAGVPVGLGVDGSASNDAGNLLAEARTALLFARAAHGVESLRARDALRLATRGGAEVLGRGAECGQISPGFRADIALWRLDPLSGAGAIDPVAALVLCPPARVHHLFVEGRHIVRDGHLTTLDPVAVAAEAGAARRRLFA